MHYKVSSRRDPRLLSVGPGTVSAGKSAGHSSAAERCINLRERLPALREPDGRGQAALRSQHPSGMLAAIALTILLPAAPAEAAQSPCPTGPTNAVDVTISHTTCAEARRVVRAWSRTCIGPLLGDESPTCSCKTSTRRYPVHQLADEHEHTRRARLLRRTGSRRRRPLQVLCRRTRTIAMNLGSRR